MSCALRLNSNAGRPIGNCFLESAPHAIAPMIPMAFQIALPRSTISKTPNPGEIVAAKKSNVSLGT